MGDATMMFDKLTEEEEASLIEEHAALGEPKTNTAPHEEEPSPPVNSRCHTEDAIQDNEEPGSYEGYEHGLDDTHVLSPDQRFGQGVLTEEKYCATEDGYMSASYPYGYQFNTKDFASLQSTTQNQSPATSDALSIASLAATMGPIPASTRGNKLSQEKQQYSFSHLDEDSSPNDVGNGNHQSQHKRQSYLASAWAHAVAPVAPSSAVLGQEHTHDEEGSAHRLQASGASAASSFHQQQLQQSYIQRSINARNATMSYRKNGKLMQSGLAYRALMHDPRFAYAGYMSGDRGTRSSHHLHHHTQRVQLGANQQRGARPYLMPGWYGASGHVRSHQAQTGAFTGSASSAFFSASANPSSAIDPHLACMPTARGYYSWSEYEQARKEEEKRTKESLSREEWKRQNTTDPSSIVKPMRPRSAYNFFYRVERMRLVAERKKIPLEEMTAIIAARWKEVGKKERLRFDIAAMCDKQRYAVERKRYKRFQDEKKVMLQQQQNEYEVEETWKPSPSSHAADDNSYAEGESSSVNEMLW